jgi:ATP-binding protein involved in chromosome partitioning
VYAVLSSKGGVGKTTISVLMALAASDAWGSAGLLDLDFVNPSTHVLLGLNPGSIEYREHRGVEPHKLDNLLYFSIVAYTRDQPLALRGKAAQDALWEVLSIVNWGRVRALFIDTPPGVGDEHLEVIYRLKDVVKPIIVSTPSRLSLNSTAKLVKLLREAGYSEIFLFENMGDGGLRGFAEEWGLTYLGYMPFTSRVEECVGEIECLRELSRELKNALKLLEAPKPRS